MVNETLVNYIKQYISQGYDITHIRDYLLQYGFKTREIDEAIDHFYKKSYNQSPQKTPQTQQYQPQYTQQAAQVSQPNIQLVQYIKTQLNAGYDINTIRNYLIQYGYKAEDVEIAVQAVMPPQPAQAIRHVVELHPKSIFMVVLAILFISGIFFGGYKLFLREEAFPQMLDYNIQIDKTELKAGEKLYFMNKITNLGEKKRYDINIEYQIINKDTFEELTSWSETIAVDVVVDKMREAVIPNDTKPGKYKLIGTVTYGNLKNTAHNSFKIISVEKKESCFDSIQNQNELGIDCGGVCEPCETCSDKIQNQNEEGIDCGGVCKPCANCADSIKNQDEEGIDCGGVCLIPCEELKDKEKEAKKEIAEELPEVQKAPGESNVDILVNAKKYAEKDPSLALMECMKIDTVTSRDTCIGDVAKLAKKSEFCDKLSTTDEKDMCYMYFVNNLNEFLLCEKITDSNTKETCSSFKEYNSYQEQVKSGDMTALQQKYGITVQDVNRPLTKEEMEELYPEGIPEAEKPKEEIPKTPEPTIPSKPSPEALPSLPIAPAETPASPSLPAPTPSAPTKEINIFNINPIKINPTTFKIKWSTDIPTTGIVKYGKASGYHTKMSTDQNLGTDHSVQITGLEIGKKYYFIILATDEAGNIKQSKEGMFETKI